MSESASNAPERPRPFGIHEWKWLAAIAGAFALLGICGLTATFSKASISPLFLGALLLLGGLLQGAEAVYVKGWKGTLWHFIIAGLYTGAGVFVLVEPASASGLFATMIAGVLVAVGLSRLFMVLRKRGEESPGMPTALAGAGALILAALLVIKWPVSGLFSTGLFVSCDLLLQSWSLLGMAKAARRPQKTASE